MSFLARLTWGLIPARKGRTHAKPRHGRLQIDVLEDRCLLDVGVTWAAIGPSPLQDSNQVIVSPAQSLGHGIY
jgi:hypothetical protein